MSYKTSYKTSLLNRIVVGAMAGAVGSLAMNAFARVLAGDGSGHGVQPPQSCVADDDATVRAGTAAFAVVTGNNPPSPELQNPLGTAMHYAFGVAMGLVYGLTAPRVPLLRRGHGALYGALVWAMADEGLMPVLGLSRGPLALSLRTHAYALSGHVIYGATLHAVTENIFRQEASLPPRNTSDRQHLQY